jgi:DUF438 domain-containing protein
MDQGRHVLETMYEEHVATLDHLAVLAQAIRAPRTVQDATLPRYRALLSTLLADVGGDVEDHFRFEERHLFPLLREAGKPELADSLTLEHVAIRTATMPVLGYLRKALAANQSESEWAEFGRLAEVLIEMNRAHMAREESEMVPVLNFR